MGAKILGREKPISKYPYKDNMVERRLSEQKVPFQDTKIPNLATADQSVVKTRTQTTDKLQSSTKSIIQIYIEQDATNYYGKFLMTMTMTINRMQQRMAKRCIIRRVIPQYFDKARN